MNFDDLCERILCNEQTTEDLIKADAAANKRPNTGILGKIIKAPFKAAKTAATAAKAIALAPLSVSRGARRLASRIQSGPAPKAPAAPKAAKVKPEPLKIPSTVAAAPVAKNISKTPARAFWRHVANRADLNPKTNNLHVFSPESNIYKVDRDVAVPVKVTNIAEVAPGYYNVTDELGRSFKRIPTDDLWVKK